MKRLLEIFENSVLAAGARPRPRSTSLTRVGIPGLKVYRSNPNWDPGLTWDPLWYLLFQLPLRLTPPLTPHMGSPSKQGRERLARIFGQNFGPEFSARLLSRIFRPDFWAGILSRHFRPEFSAGILSQILGQNFKLELLAGIWGRNFKPDFWSEILSRNFGPGS